MNNDNGQYLAGILENAVDAIISIEANGTILTLNPAAEAIFGYSANELIGKNVKMLMPAPYHEEHDGYLENYLKTGDKKVIGVGRDVTGQRKDAGFSAYLVKPVDPSILMDTLMLVIHYIETNQIPSQLITRHSIEQSKLKNKIDNRYKPPTKTIRVLLAEDNLVNQKVAKKLLEKLNCIIDVAANGKEAVNMVKQFPYQLIFMDCQMPEIDGYEATGEIKKYLKENQSNILIIAMTANTIKGDKEKCIAAGMGDYLSKPIDKSKLAKTINIWLKVDHLGKIVS